MTVSVIRSAALAGVPHGFLGRQGGVSTGLYAALNVGSGSTDHPAAVAENRVRAAAAVLPGARLVTVHQVHGASAVMAGDWDADARPHADAIVADRPGVLIGALTADCVPVLLADENAGVVAAAHAGWKGALAGVTNAAIALMIARGARTDRIAAAIGPCIGRRSYEVDFDFARCFEEADPSNERFFAATPRPDRALFDIEGYVAHRLAAAGVGRVDALGFDTYADEERFFSYRRATHRAEPDYGRQVALIGVG